MKKKKKLIDPIGIVWVLLILFCIVVGTKHPHNNAKKYISFSEFTSHVVDGNIQHISVKSDGITITATLNDGSIVLTNNPNTEESNNIVYNSGLYVEQSAIVNSGKSLLDNILFIVLTGITIMIVYSMFKGPGSKTMFEEGINTRPQISNVKFDDVAGSEESKEALEEILHYLKFPEKFKKYGVKAPKGCLLYGPPGTGKTLLAKALAGEAHCTFISVTGSNFVDKFVGNGASRVRHLFAEAKKKKPCIIFIDEIDAIGGKRNSIGGNEERNQTLNELLSCMNGFNDDDTIVVIGATNRLDSLDDALTRSGRFDTKIYVGLPDLSARKKIFEVHCKKKPMASDIDYNLLARTTTYFSGADIENVMNKAGFYAAKQNKEFIDMSDVQKGINHLIAGDEKKDRTGISEDDKKLTAYHEAGHALVAKLMVGISVPKISIIPTTHGAGGYTLIDDGERSYKRKCDLENQIAIALGGRAAEEIIFGKENITTGASNDIQKVTQIAESMIRVYGMSNTFGLISTADSNKLDSKVLESAKELVDAIYEKTISYLQNNIDILHTLANKLIDVETLDESEFDTLVKQN